MNTLPPLQAFSTDLSPLEQIQQVEAEVSRRIAAQREDAHRAELRAREQASVLLREAQAQGQCEGQAEYERQVAQATREAQALCEQARAQADHMRRTGDQCMESAVQLALAILTGMTQE